MMFDAKRLLDQLVGSGAAGGFAGGLAGGALANVLGSKKGRKLGGSALKLGGLAVVGGLAYKAWRDYQQGQATPAGEVPVPPADTGFLPSENDHNADDLSRLLVRSMIGAAKADGSIDTQESQAILNRINELQLPAEDKAFLFEEYSRPLDIAAIARDVDSTEHAVEVYAASALMVDPPSPPERIYLDSLARELNLEDGLVRQIHATLAAESGG